MSLLFVTCVSVLCFTSYRALSFSVNKKFVARSSSSEVKAEPISEPESCSRVEVLTAVQSTAYSINGLENKIR